jgi:hypothetical protein
MAGKKVIDSEKFRDHLYNMKYKTYAPQPYVSYNSYGNPDMDTAIRGFSSLMSAEISKAINTAMQMVIEDIIIAVNISERDEMESMCGLCRPREGETPPQF